MQPNLATAGSNPSPHWRFNVADLGRLAVISPHLDDAAMACGALLACAANATVITVFAGKPPSSAALTAWDERCGFTNGEAAMEARREEDLQAMRILGSKAIHLDYLDHQYGATPATADVARSIERLLLLHHVATVVFPLGMFHDDHALVHQACLDVLDNHPSLRWLAYEETLYRRKPALLQQRLARLHQRHLIATPIEINQHAGLSAKLDAVLAYASQRRELGLDRDPGDTAAPERYWIVNSAVPTTPRHASDPG